RVLAAAAVLLVSGRADAQWGMGGWGGGWGWGGGPFGSGIGMSLYDQQMVKDSYYSSMAAQYNMMNAQAAQAYQSANLMQQQAVQTALQNQQLSRGIADKYVLSKQEAWANRKTAAIDHLNQLFDPRGNLLWPNVTPYDADLVPKRQEVDDAFRTIFQQTRGGSSPSVQSLVAAKQKLYAFGKPAL